MTQPTVSSQSRTAGGIRAEHYPSLELCIKLTDADFPVTYWSRDNHQLYGDKGDFGYRCPSIAELLDELPDTIAQDYLLHFWKNNDRQYGVQYQEVNGHGIGECGKGFETLPNALAEMWLWLKENNYLP